MRQIDEALEESGRRLDEVSRDQTPEYVSFKEAHRGVVQAIKKIVRRQDRLEDDAGGPISGAFAKTDSRFIWAIEEFVQRLEELDEAARDPNTAHAKNLFPVSPEAKQLYVSAFTLEPDETVLLDVPVEFPMTYLGFTRRSRGEMGVTDHRLLFSKHSLLGTHLSQRRLEDATDVRRPGRLGIEIGANRGRYDRVFLTTADQRNLLADYILFEAIRSYYSRYL